jgi:hypothetical protein
MPLTRPKDVGISVSILGGDLFMGSSNSTSYVSGSGLSMDLEARTECKTTKVGDDNTCTILTVKCGIWGADFVKYNIKQNLYSTLKAGQLVCCSSGTLPDNTPTADSDGTYATHKIDHGDTCSSVAEALGITVKDIETYNKNS